MENDRTHRLLNSVGFDKENLRNNLKANIREYDYLIGYLDTIKERIYKSESFTARISCEL